MKKSGILYLALGMLICAGACSKNTKEKDENSNQVVNRDIAFESYTIDMIGEYPDSMAFDAPGSKYVRFMGQGVLPRDLGQSEIQLLRDTLMKIAHVTFSDPSSPEPVFSDGITLTTLSPTDTVACGEINSNLSTTLVTPRVIVWENELYAYPCMAAHGYQSTTFINFCMTDGKIIELSDLLKKDYKKPLEKIIRNKIREQGVDLLVALNEVEIPVEFAITSKGLLFSYDPYQIAPYSEGTVQVEIPVGELQPLLSSHGKYILLGTTE